MTVAASSSPARLRRALGRWDLAAIGINQVIGGAIFVWPAQVAAHVGAWSPIGFVLIGLLSLSVALCFAEVGSRFDGTGGPYLYSRAAFGDFAGFEIGWMQWFARATSQASIMTATAVALGYYWPSLTAGWRRAAVLFVLTTAFAAINVRGVRQSAWAVNLLTIGKLVPLAIFIVAGIGFVDVSRLTRLPPLTAEHAGAAALLLIFIYGGYEVVPVPAGEAVDPRRDVPFAMVATVLGAMVVMTLTQIVAQGVLPDVAAHAMPIADAAAAFLGPAGALLVGVGCGPVQRTGRADCAGPRDSRVPGVGGRRDATAVAGRRRGAGGRCRVVLRSAPGVHAMTISTTHIEGADIRFQPAMDALKPFIGCFWVVTAEPGATLRVVPDGTTAISIELRRGSRREWHLRGPMLRAGERRFADAATLVGVRLRPGVAFLVSGTPAHAIADRSVALCHHPAFRALLASDTAGAQPAQCIDRLERFLLKRLAGATVHPVVAAALRNISDSGGGVSIATLADRCGVTPRHLHRLMRVWVGCGPKRYATIVRFQSTLGQMQHAPAQTPAVLASDAGYFDQAHLAIDLGRFAGATPARLRTAVSDFSKTRCDDLP